MAFKQFLETFLMATDRFVLAAMREVITRWDVDGPMDRLLCFNLRYYSAIHHEMRVVGQYGMPDLDAELESCAEVATQTRPVQPMENRSDQRSRNAICLIYDND